MERLTKLGRVMGEVKVCCTHFDCKECNDLSGQCSDGCSWEEMAWEKLYDYEETGLTPEQVAAMKAELQDERYRHDRYADYSRGQDEVIDRLKAELRAYQDTGLTPEICAAFKKFEDEAISKGVTFNRIVELMEAEKDGRLFIAPVKVGDMLWPVYWDEVLGAWSVDDVPERVNEVGSKGFFIAACLGDPEAPDEFHPYEEIGKEFFLTREKAKAAITKLEEVRDHA